MVRVAFIGAGSVEFTKNLLGDILDYSELGDVEIALHDIDPDRLSSAESMARYVARERGVAPRISAHDDRRAALEGADYVINMVQIGGHPSTLVDFELPRRYGLRQTIADTLGIGGIFRTLRTADHMLALGRDMAELCPRAWLLNYTNPMAMLCWLVYAGTPTSQVVGLCHSIQYTIADLARLVGVPEDEITFFAAGVNHQAFILRFEREGEDLYPRLDARIAADPELQRRVRVALYQRLGCFPTESSEHAAEYVPWFMRHDGELERFRIPVDEYVRRSEANLVEYAAVREMLLRGESMPIERSIEYAAPIIHSIETGEPRVI
jgi:alpha-galactosidase